MLVPAPQAHAGGARGILALSIHIFLVERNKFSPGSPAAAHAKVVCGLRAQSTQENRLHLITEL